MVGRALGGRHKGGTTLISATATARSAPTAASLTWRRTSGSVAHRARLHHRCGGGGRADRAAPGSHLQMARALAALRPAPQPSSKPRLTVPNMFGLCAALAARGCSAPVRATGRRRRLPAPRCSSTLRPSRAPARRRCPQRASPLPERTGGEGRSLLGGHAPHPPRPRSAAADPHALLALLLRVAVVAARPPERAAARRGWRVGAAVLEGVAAIAFALFDAAAAASLRARSHLQCEGVGDRMNTCVSTMMAAAELSPRLRRRRTWARRCAAGLRRRRPKRVRGGAYRVCGNAEQRPLPRGRRRRRSRR